MIPYSDIKALFETANQSLLTCDKELFENQVSERTLCGALMLHFHNCMQNDSSKWNGYHADVEYNRNKGSIRGFKTIYSSGSVIRINCDLIIHSRGHITEQDNLIAIEVKKSTRHPAEKNKDRERLIALTSTPSAEGVDSPELPEHVCGYALGVYYEINYHRRSILIEYYRHGEIAESSTLYF